jgi:hypothetical protein
VRKAALSEIPDFHPGAVEQKQNGRKTAGWNHGSLPIDSASESPGFDGHERRREECKCEWLESVFGSESSGARNAKSVPERQGKEHQNCNPQTERHKPSMVLDPPQCCL